jgi:16S rRNA G527 N7-methylase RsmG
VPIAIARPDVLITLSEKRRQRAAFLELVVGELSLSNVQVHPGDARGLPGPYDACLARAFGDIAKAWELAEPRLSEHGALVYWAGRSFDRARGVPDGTLVTLLDPPTLANSGPIAIMTRQ